MLFLVCQTVAFRSFHGAVSDWAAVCGITRKSVCFNVKLIEEQEDRYRVNRRWKTWMYWLVQCEWVKCPILYIFDVFFFFFLSSRWFLSLVIHNKLCSSQSFADRCFFFFIIHSDADSAFNFFFFLFSLVLPQLAQRRYVRHMNSILILSTLTQTVIFLCVGFFFFYFTLAQLRLAEPRVCKRNTHWSHRNVSFVRRLSESLSDYEKHIFL